jgi:hypothetical protein
MNMFVVMPNSIASKNRRQIALKIILYCFCLVLATKKVSACQSLKIDINVLVIFFVKRFKTVGFRAVLLRLRYSFKFKYVYPHGCRNKFKPTQRTPRPKGPPPPTAGVSHTRGGVAMSEIEHELHQILGGHHQLLS